MYLRINNINAKLKICIFAFYSERFGRLFLAAEANFINQIDNSYKIRYNKEKYPQRVFPTMKLLNITDENDR